MTNAEWLIKLISNGETEELADKGLALGCSTCAFNDTNMCDDGNCPTGFRHWLGAEHDVDRSRAITLDKNGNRTSWMSENAYIVYLPTAEVVETFKNYWQENAKYVNKPTTYIRAYFGDDWVFFPTTRERDCYTNQIREIDKLLGILWDYAGIGKGDK